MSPNHIRGTPSARLPFVPFFTPNGPLPALHNQPSSRVYASVACFPNAAWSPKTKYAVSFRLAGTALNCVAGQHVHFAWVFWVGRTGRTGADAVRLARVARSVQQVESVSCTSLKAVSDTKLLVLIAATGDDIH